MLKRLLFNRSAVPSWLDENHPMMKREISHEGRNHRPSPAWIKWLWWFGLFLSAFLFLMIGWNTIDIVSHANSALSLSETLFAWQLFPLYFMQVMLFISTFNMGMDTIKNQRLMNRWDEIRSTSDGVRLIMWARWGYLTFYHNALLLKVIYFIRFLMILTLLIDLTAFGGNYLNYLLLNSTPSIPLALGVMLVGANITAGLLLPISMISLTCAISLLLSTYFRQPILALLGKFVFVLIYLSVSIFFMMLLSSLYFETAQEYSSILASRPIEGGVFLVILTSIYVDWGTNLLFLGFMGEHIWSNIPYGVFTGALIIGVIIIQAFLAEWIMRYAVYRADKLM